MCQIHNPLLFDYNTLLGSQLLTTAHNSSWDKNENKADSIFQKDIKQIRTYNNNLMRFDPRQKVNDCLLQDAETFSRNWW